MQRMTLIAWTALALSPAAAEPATANLDERLSTCRGPYSVKLEQVSFTRLFSTLADLGKACSLRFDVASELAATTASLRLQDVRMSTVLEVLAGEHGLEYVLTDDGGIRVRRPEQAARPRLQIRPCADSTGEGCAEIDGRPYRFARGSRVTLPQGGTLLTVTARPKGEPVER